MTIRLDMYVFSAISEAIERGESIVFHGCNSEGVASQIEVPESVIRSCALLPGVSVAGQTAASLALRRQRS